MNLFSNDIISVIDNYRVKNMNYDVSIESILMRLKKGDRKFIDYPDYKKYKHKVTNMINSRTEHGVYMGTFEIKNRNVEVWCHRNCKAAIIYQNNVMEDYIIPRYLPIEFNRGECTIILPPDLFLNDDEIYYKFVLFHELAHVDHIDVSFHPIKVWLRQFAIPRKIFEMIDELEWKIRFNRSHKEHDMEIAADISSIITMNISRSDYETFMVTWINDIRNTIKKEYLSNYLKIQHHRMTTVIDYVWGSKRNKLDRIIKNSD